MLSRIRAKGLLWPALATVLGVAFLIGLGTWQMQRLAWKQGLIGAIAERTHAEPVPLAAVEARAAEGGDPEYARVKVEGRLLNDHELAFYAFDERLGPGYHVVTPFERADGSIVFVNRGFVPQDLKDAAKRPAGQLAGEVSIVGLVRVPPPPGLFTPANDAAKNVWYWYDLGAMAAAALGPGEKRVVPFIVDAEVAPSLPGSLPKGGTTRLELPNRHLEYALTWYGLAAALVAVFVAFAVTHWRQPGGKPPGA
jgi:surfeit locus 1 family protein